MTERTSAGMLVTGATGTTGRHICAELSTADAVVVAASRAAARHRRVAVSTSTGTTPPRGAPPWPASTGRT